MQHKFELDANAVVNADVFAAKILEDEFLAPNVPEHKLNFVKEVLGLVLGQLTTRLNKLPQATPLLCFKQKLDQSL